MKSKLYLAREIEKSRAMAAWCASLCATAILLALGWMLLTSA